MFVRKKMNPKYWKQLHKLAYVAYVFIYIHLAFNIYINPNYGYFIPDADALLYHFILLLYVTLHVIFVIIPKHQKKRRN
jgi:DMSO/TMAO reductase YedYZ heme-binding membrane subunit